MHRCHGDVGGIHSSLRWQQMLCQNFPREILRGFGVFQDLAVRQNCFPGFGGGRVTATRFGQHKTGNEKLIFLSAVIPPIPCGLLLTGNQNIPARPSGQ